MCAYIFSCLYVHTSVTTHTHTSYADIIVLRWYPPSLALDRGVSGGRSDLCENIGKESLLSHKKYARASSAHVHIFDRKVSPVIPLRFCNIIWNPSGMGETYVNSLEILKMRQ